MSEMEALLNTYVPPVRKPNSGVTMNKPLEPWDGVFAFHRYLAMHIHGATRVAGDNDGIAADCREAIKLDVAPRQNAELPA